MFAFGQAIVKLLTLAVLSASVARATAIPKTDLDKRATAKAQVAYFTNW